jgi:phosphoserine phosphatase RsbU/P
MHMQPMRVLLIEDNVDDANLLKVLLEDPPGSQVSIVWSATLVSAIKNLSIQSFDVILLDLSLEDSSGAESVRKLRRATQVPIVVLTGQSDQSVAMLALEEGAQDYLVKGEPSPASVVRCMRYAIERDRADKALRELSLIRQRELFVGTLAHDLRTPLVGTQRVLNALKVGCAGEVNPDQELLLSQVISSNESLLIMIANVMDLYRLEAGVQMFLFAPHKISIVVNDSIKQLKPLLEAKKIEIELDLADEVVASIDALAMTRVLNNLLSNAVKFTPSGGKITFIVKRERNQASISIIDTGTGIDAEKIDHVFTKFYQADQSYCGLGTGIGLYLCKQLIHAHNGQIRCTSAKGSGTRFDITLPLVQFRSEDEVILDLITSA